MTRLLTLHVGLPAALALLAFLCGAEGLFPSNRICGVCDGEGRLLQTKTLFARSPGSCVVESGEITVFVGCDACKASGIAPPTPKFLSSLFPKLVLGVWEFVCIAVAAALVWGLRSVDCRLCGGSGQLALEALPPGETGFLVDVDCVRCEGRGRIRLLRRWLKAAD